MIGTTIRSSATPDRVHHREPTPVFVVGHARSGTSILTKLIRQHLQIAFGTESQFIVRLAEQANKAGDLTNESNRRRFIEMVAQERFFTRTRRNYGFAFDVDAALETTRTGTYRSVLDAVFGQLAAHMGHVRWGDKTPEYALHMPVLQGLYPEARFVNVVRDGRDVALSIFEEQFGAKNIFVAARHWAACLQAVADFRRSHPRAQVLDVRYEDLLDEPGRVFEGLVQFLDIDDSGGLSRSVGTAVRQQLRAGNSRKWKTRLSRDEQRIFEAVAGAWLQHFKYECVAGPLPAPGALTTLRWTLDDAFKKARRGDYWRDNMYRLGLRLGPLGAPLRQFGVTRKRR
jgi:hypothetical protein